MEKKLTRSTDSSKMIFGVCAGLGKYFNLDATLVRIIWAIATIVGFGSPILIYVVLGLIIPKEA